VCVACLSGWLFGCLQSELPTHFACMAAYAHEHQLLPDSESASALLLEVLSAVAAPPDGAVNLWQQP